MQPYTVWTKMFIHVQTLQFEDDMIWEEIPKEIELDDENSYIDPFEDVDELDCISEEENKWAAELA